MAATFLQENSGGSLIFLQKDSGAAAQAQLIFDNIIGGSAAGVLSPDMIWILAIVLECIFGQNSWNSGDRILIKKIHSEIAGTG